MSRWKGYEIQDILGYEDSSVSHFLSLQDGEKAFESVAFSESYKKPRYESINDIKTCIYREGSTDEVSLPRIIDGRVFSYALKEGDSSVLDVSWPLTSEKDTQAIDITKCSTGSTILDCQGSEISCSVFREGEIGTRSVTLFSDYPFPGKCGRVNQKKLGDVSSSNVLAGVQTKDQKNGEDDLQFYDCHNNGEEYFDRMFRNLGSTVGQESTVTKDETPWLLSSSRLHGMEDTLQSVVLSSVSETSAFNNTTSSHGLSANILPALAINAEVPSSTGCSSFPTYTVTERNNKSVLSELECDHTGLVGKSLELEQIGYGSGCRYPNMIYTTIKELCTTAGKKINPNLGMTVESPFSGCSMIQNGQDQDLLSSVMSAPQHCSFQVISKEKPLPESYASNHLHSYNFQALMRDNLALPRVPPSETTLNSSVINSSALPDYISPIYVPQSMGTLPGSFSMPSTPIQKCEKLYACQKLPAPSDSSVQRKYEVEVNKERALNIPAVNAGSSTLQDNSHISGSFLDDVTVKVVNFQQLRMNIDQLGDRTKLCIRDSLYRLAISAEQSHYNCIGNNNANSGDSHSTWFHGSMDSKRPPPISTNAIERAVAYLLFHKSLDSSGTATADDCAWFRSPIHISGKCKETICLLHEKPN